MKKIAFVAYQSMPELTDNDHLLLEYLQPHGVAPQRFSMAVMACLGTNGAPAKPQETGGMETQTSLC